MLREHKLTYLLTYLRRLQTEQFCADRLLSLLMRESSFSHWISGAVTSDDDVTEQSSLPGVPAVITVSTGSTANRSELNADSATNHRI